MTQSQLDAQRCGMIPEENPPEFFAKHLSAYHFARPRVAGQKVLEIGFGDGYGSSYLAEAAAQVVGVDIAPQNVPLAQAKYPRKNLTFLQVDGHRLPFAGGSFDAACTFQVIEHVPEPDLGGWLKEIRRVLKPGGRLFVSTLNPATAQKPGQPYEKNRDHEKEFTAPELEALLGGVFGRVRLYGLHYSLRHRFCRRLKKWGLERWGFVRRHFGDVTVDAFVVRERDTKGSVDLIAVCEG